jgi:DDE superfamily endonuclease
VGVPVTQWSAQLLGAYLRRQEFFAFSDRMVSRILRDADLQPHRQKMWLTSQDDEFRQKRDDILHLYYDAPVDEHIVCLDEKTGIQALERKFADIPMSRGQPIRREYEYIRHGTVCLMGGYNVRLHKLFGFTTQGHDSLTFVDLLDFTDSCHPDGRGHIVCDNLFAHATDDVLDWFDDHPRWTLHFTPKHASWLNQIECAFSILQRHVLTRGSFRSTEELTQRIYQYMGWFNQQPSNPFRWSYRPKSWGNTIGKISGERN